MADPALNGLLQWAIKNTDASLSDPTTTVEPKLDVDPKHMETLARILAGGKDMPTEPEMMKKIMIETLPNLEIPLDHRKLEFRNFEGLIQNIDNANCIHPMGLWDPLIQKLEEEEWVFRAYAAWCIGTAVSNNEKAQEQFSKLDAVPTLVRLATQDVNPLVRKKATGAISSASRNFQPTLDIVVQHLPAQFKPEGAVDATDMEAVDSLLSPIRAETKKLEKDHDMEELYREAFMDF